MRWYVLYVHFLQPLQLQIDFVKIAWFLDAPETNFLQSTELTKKLNFLVTSNGFSLDSDLVIFGYRFLPILANLFVEFGYKSF